LTSLASRIQDLLGAAVPEITGVRIVGPHVDPPPAGGGRFADRVRAVLDAEVNPMIAVHGGRVVLVEADQGWVQFRLEGGCQGCSLAEVTIRQGIEPLLRTRVPRWSAWPTLPTTWRDHAVLLRREAMTTMAASLGRPADWTAPTAWRR